MTLVTLKNRPTQRSFNNLMNDFFPNLPSLLGEDFTSVFRSSVPVNLRETENGFVLEVIAPGLEKEDFKISLDKNILTVSAEKKNETEEKEEKQILREYRFTSFKRSFTLNELVDVENIGASYLNGVLTLNLPKKAEEKASVKEINVQ